MFEAAGDTIILEGQAHFGQITRNSLGFDDWLVPTIHPKQQGLTICAHAPSHVTIETGVPLAVRGFINASGSIDIRNPIEFLADHNLIGVLHRPGGYTSSMNIAPGRHRLEAYCTTPACGRHSVWHLDTARDAPPNDTAVLTLATYPDHEIRNKLRLLQLSCHNESIPLVVVGVNESFQDWYHSKIMRIARAIEALPDSVGYIVFVDGVDSLFARPLADIRSAFLAIGRGVVISAEGCCWPCRDEEWSNSFPHAPNGFRFPCAGVWMAERQAFFRAVDAIGRIRGKLMAGDARDKEVERFWSHRGFHDNDQFLWQCLYKYELADVTIDSECSIAFNVACAGTNIDNRYFDFDAACMRATGLRPGIFHFSSAKYQCMDQWYALLKASRIGD